MDAAKTRTALEWLHENKARARIHTDAFKTIVDVCVGKFKNGPEDEAVAFFDLAHQTIHNFATCVWIDHFVGCKYVLANAREKYGLDKCCMSRSFLVGINNAKSLGMEKLNAGRYISGLQAGGYDVTKICDHLSNINYHNRKSVLRCVLRRNPTAFKTAPDTCLKVLLAENRQKFKRDPAVKRLIVHAVEHRDYDMFIKLNGKNMMFDPGVFSPLWTDEPFGAANEIKVFIERLRDADGGQYINISRIFRCNEYKNSARCVLIALLATEPKKHHSAISAYAPDVGLMMREFKATPGYKFENYTTLGSETRKQLRNLALYCGHGGAIDAFPELQNETVDVLKTIVRRYLYDPALNPDAVPMPSMGRLTKAAGRKRPLPPATGQTNGPATKK